MPLSSIISFITGVLENLPEILFYIQSLTFLFLILFFGRLSITGYRSYIPAWLRLSLKPALGFISLLASFFLSSLLTADLFLPGMDALQIDTVGAGIATSLLLMLSMFLISRNIPNTSGVQKAIESLSSRLERARKSKNSILNPTALAGLVIILALAATSFFTFPGYPNLADKIYSEMGTTPEEIDSLLSLASNVPGVRSGASGAISIAAVANRLLPTLLPVVQNIAYIFLSLGLFGWVATLGLRTRLPRSQRALLRAASGFFSLFVGISLSQYITFSSNPYTEAVLEIMQFHVIAGGLLASVVTGIAIFLISLNLFSIPGLEAEIEKLRRKLDSARSMQKNGSAFKRPSMIAGLSILIIMMLLALPGLGSVPDISSSMDNAFVEMGMSRQEIISQLKTFQSQASLVDSYLNQSGLPEGCPSLADVFLANSQDILSGKLTTYVGQEAKSVMESGSGENISAMFVLDYENQKVVIGYTETGRICSTVSGVFCECLDINELSGSAGLFANSQ